MKEFDLVDVYREKNPKNKSYTYESKALKLYSRIDFFLIPRHQISWVEQIETLVSNAPDHKAVKLKLNSPDNKRGPGLWKFNNSLLDDEGYVTKGSIVRSKTRWIEQGEKPTKYFFNLEKPNYNHKTIKELKHPDGKSVTKEEEIVEEIEIFYKELYTSIISVENAQFTSFTENLELPRLEDSVSSELEGDITLKECKDILSTFSRGKSPGEDGFTWEFYNCFFDLLDQDLVDSFNASYRAGEMAPSQRRGAITLIPKEDSDLSSLANWRPITLLNVDHKIVSKVVTKRLEKVLTFLIKTDQTGFIKGRYIGQNIRLINDILEQATFLVYFYSSIFERLSTQLNGNLYKEPLRYLILEEAFNAGFPYFMSTQRVQF